MTGIFASIRVTGKPRCARCKRPFTPRKEGDRYGPTCARKLGGLAGIRDRIDENQHTVII